METFSALLAICAVNSPVIGEFPAHRPVTRSFDVFFICAWINGWVNSREAGDLRRHGAHYDITVMRLTWQLLLSHPYYIRDGAISCVGFNISSVWHNNYWYLICWITVYIYYSIYITCMTEIKAIAILYIGLTISAIWRNSYCYLIRRIYSFIRMKLLLSHTYYKISHVMLHGWL